jgi:geranylgeranyl diphosphate synthase type II
MAKTDELFPVDKELEQALAASLPSPDTPPEVLHRAMHRAVFSGGKRIRPRVLIAVAEACGAQGPVRRLVTHAACAIEYVHTASLIHDDLPCFDDAAERRGQPTLHRVVGEAMAVLAGDALLARAFEVLSDGPKNLSARALRLVNLFGRATGTTHGIIGGQGLEEELLQSGARDPASRSQALLTLPPDDLDRYHAMKTVALFRLATSAGAAAAGVRDLSTWIEIGLHLGLAYKLFDDVGATRGGAAPREAALPGALGARRARVAGLIEEALVLAEDAAADVGPLREFLAPILAFVVADGAAE